MYKIELICRVGIEGEPGEDFLCATHEEAKGRLREFVDNWLLFLSDNETIRIDYDGRVMSVTVKDEQEKIVYGVRYRIDKVEQPC